MKELPILFNTEMVQAILSGRKTQSRRPVKKDLSNRFDLERDGSLEIMTIEDEFGDQIPILNFSPFGQVGDRLYVRETCYIHNEPNKREPNGTVYYVADIGKGKGGKCTPSIHMPKWASRIWLEITDIRVERVNDITMEDAFYEGMTRHIRSTLGWGSSESEETFNLTQTKSTFRHLWQSIYKNWADNPWVWVIEFKRIDNGSIK